MKRLILLFALAGSAFAQTESAVPAVSGQSGTGTRFTSTFSAQPACSVGDGIVCENHTGVFSTPFNGSGTGHRVLIHNELKTYGPSISLGLGGQWTVTSVVSAPHVVFGTSGIDQYQSARIVKNGVGDLGGIYYYVYGGGRSAQYDEGVTGMTVQSGEINGYFHGTVGSGGGMGATALNLSITANAPHNWDSTCVGCMLLDISKGTIAGSLNGRSIPLQGTYLNQLPTSGVTVGGSPGNLPITRAWCTTLTAIPASTTAGAGTSRTVDCTLGTIGGSTPAFTSGGVVTIAGQFYPEQAPLTQAGSPSGGVQRLTLLARNPNPVGSLIFQGGIAGQSLSFDANLAATGFRSSYYVFGSLDGVNLIYGSEIAGDVRKHTLPRQGAEAETTTSGFHLYPSAEIVANTEQNSAPLLEPNAVNWQTGDVVENPRYQSFGGTGIRDGCYQYTPQDEWGYTSCLRADVIGPGVAAGYKPFLVGNSNPTSLYRQGGGALDPVTAMYLAGPFGDLLYSRVGPAPSAVGLNAVIDIAATAIGDNTPFNLFALPTGTTHGTTKVTYDPATHLIGFPQGLVAGSLGTAANCSLKTNCGAASSGSFAVPAGSNSVTVTTSAVTANSQIQITPDASLGAACNKDPASAFAPYGISARTPGRSFTLSIAGSGGNGSNCYSFTIIN